MKETPKLTTKNWYAWNPCLQNNLSNWPPALKHLNGITKPGDKKFNQKLDKNLCTILQSHAKLTGTNNINYLFIQPAKAEPWKLHKLYTFLKKDLTKMEHH
ncbi:hypothetical protein NDA10_007965 [Ustilago hordei]|nr:hypothetical protein NDA10_007965 [Ustilago hordei]